MIHQFLAEMCTDLPFFLLTEDFLGDFGRGMSVFLGMHELYQNL